MLLIVTMLFPLLIGACTSIPQAQFKESLSMAEDACPAPILFTKLKMELPAGSDVGTIYNFGMSTSSWFVVPANRYMLQKAISTKELSSTFNMVLEGQGYDVVDYLDPIFEEEAENEYLRTEYRIGGKIIDAKMNIDHEGYKRFGAVIYGNSGKKGELYLKIKWSIYDALRRTTVYTTITEGTGKLRYADPEGMTLMLNNAFEMAAHNLSSDIGFYDLLVNGIKPDNWKKHKKQDDRPLKYDSQEQVNIEPQSLSSSPLTQHINETKKAVVIVQGGAGHGSGFFITKNGHILTNQHVVGNAQRVRIVTANKKEKLIAQVLRINRARDVALLKLEEKIDNMKITTLPLRIKLPAVSEDIYAIGTPKATRLQDTLTKGIVSAHRPKYRFAGSRMDFIQGDITIHGGNSGGPLLDKNGNIIGLTVSGFVFGEDRANSNLNLFIPIGDALKKLNINVDTNDNSPLNITYQ